MKRRRRRRNPGDFESPDAACPTDRPSELTQTHMDGQRGRVKRVHFHLSVPLSYVMSTCDAHFVGFCATDSRATQTSVVLSEKFNGSGLRKIKLALVALPFRAERLCNRDNVFSLDSFFDKIECILILRRTAILFYSLLVQEQFSSN